MSALFKSSEDATDIEDHTRAETLLAGEHRLLEMVAKGSSLDKTLDALCRLVEQVSPQWLASILLVDDKADGVWHGAAPTLPPTYICALDGKRVSPMYGPCALAAQGQQVVASDIATDTRWSPEYRELALLHGLRSCWSTPIKASNGKVLGVFEIYLRCPGDLLAQQEKWLAPFTHLASIAIERAHVIPADVGGEMLEALRCSEERYARVMEAAEEGHWEWDISADEVFVSERMKEMLGFAPSAQFAGRADFFARLPIHPEDRGLVTEARERALSGATPRYEIEYRVLPRPGEMRWVRSRAKVFRNEDGRPVRIAGSFIDITERKLAGEALRSSEERYARAMEASGEGFWDWDIATDEYYVSPQMNTVLGFPPGTTFKSRSDFLGRVPFHSEDYPKWQEAVAACFAGKCARLDIEIRVLPPGETRWIHLRGLLSRDSSGNPVRWTGSCANVTERRVAEDALRLSEHRYALAMEATGEGHWDWDIPSDKFYASPLLLEMCGLPVDTTFATRAEWLEAFPFYPEDRPRYEQAVAEHFAGKTARLDMEIRIVPRGETRWIRMTGLCLRGASGAPIRWAGSVIDITEHKVAGEALRESEARFRSLTELSFDWYWRQDENLRFTYLSSQAFDLTGYTGDSSIGKLRWELVNMRPLSGSWDEHKAVLAARKTFRDLECARVGRDGVTRYLSMTGAPIFDDEGRFKGYHGIGRNITEQKHIEAELRARQDMLDLAQKAARAVAFEWRIGTGEEKHRLSPELEVMHGLAPGSHDGKFETWKKLIHPDDWPVVRAAFKAAQQSGDVAAEYRIVHKDGTVRWLQAKGRMFIDEAGKPAKMVGFLLDVTERHLAEEELRRMEHELRQAQRLEAMGTLAGGIAHDFNNLLGAILGYGEMALRDAPSGSRLRRDVESIMIAGERGRALVDRILAFSRSGISEHVPVQVQEVIRETLALFAAKLPDGVAIEQRLRAGRAAVLGDATQIHQVLMNLATNAVQAMPSGGTLRVALDRVVVDAPRSVTIGSVAAKEYVVLHVSDTGSGMAPEILERVFDPFFTTKEVGVGTGLGLSLVHGIVTGLGGAIDVATTIGKGSTFRVYLPRWGNVATGATSRKRVQPAPSHGHRERILVVDDEEALVTLVTETLNDLGYEASGFTSSAIALDTFNAGPQRFDAVITDESMPGMSGSELIRNVRKRRPTIPILLVSGYLSAAVVRRAHEAGADDVLRKPLSADDLGTSLARLLREAKRSPDRSQEPRSAEDLSSPRSAQRRSASRKRATRR